MKRVAIGAHLHEDDVRPLADAVSLGGVWLSAFAIPDDQPLGDRTLLVKVAAIRASLLDRATFIAIRYGWAFSADEEAKAKCAALIPRWKTLLTEHRHDVEMTLKIPAVSTRPRPDRRDFSSGADYLRALHEAANAAAIDDRFRRDIERLIVPRTLQHRWIHRDNTSLELAMLINRDDVAVVYAAGEEMKKTGAPAFLLSGPWPLEVFSE